VSEYLPEDDAECPDVTLVGVVSVFDALRRHPPHWQHSTAPNLHRDFLKLKQRPRVTDVQLTL
jgi:hypothetical protein